MSRRLPDCICGGLHGTRCETCKRCVAELGIVEITLEGSDDGGASWFVVRGPRVYDYETLPGVARIYRVKP